MGGTQEDIPLGKTPGRFSEVGSGMKLTLPSKPFSNNNNNIFPKDIANINVFTLSNNIHID